VEVKASHFNGKMKTKNNAAILIHAAGILLWVGNRSILLSRNTPSFCKQTTVYGMSFIVVHCAKIIHVYVVQTENDIYPKTHSNQKICAPHTAHTLVETKKITYPVTHQYVEIAAEASSNLLNKVLESAKNLRLRFHFLQVLSWQPLSNHNHGHPTCHY
jgi:hypothetical protein